MELEYPKVTRLMCGSILMLYRAQRGRTIAVFESFDQDSPMRYGLLWSLLVISTIAAWPAVPEESDYSIQYEVMNTSTVGSWMIGNFCTMALRDKGNAGLA